MLVATVLAVLCLFRVVQSVAAIREAPQLDSTESIVYDKAGRLLRNQALYQPLDEAPYTVSAYMPLYPLLAAGLRIAVGEGFGRGRALSLAGGVGAACLAKYLAGASTRDRKAGLFAAGLFLSLAFPGMYPWLALYRVDVPGVTFALASIAVLRSCQTTGHIILAALLASLAILTKQFLLAAAVAGCIWLLTLDRRKCVLFAGIVSLGVLVPSALLEMTTGAFLVNTVYANLNPMRADVLFANLAIFLSFQAGPLVAAVIYVVRRRASQPYRDLLIIYWIA
jgi:hypothetical protein